MARSLRNLLVAAVALAFVPAAAHATISQAMSFDEKVDNAAAIVLGKCVRTNSQWDSAHKWILTYSTFEVEQSMKGAPAQQITIVTPGGTVDGVHQDTIGIPKFAIGNEHVVFVRNTQAGPTVLYFDQGAYEVETVRGEKMVKPLTSSAVLIDTQRGMAVAPEQPRTLREFTTSVRDTIRRREAMRMEMIQREKQADASFVNVVKRNRLLIILALVGAALATWQLVKRW